MTRGEQAAIKENLTRVRRKIQAREDRGMALRMLREEGLSKTEIAYRLGITPTTVRRWAKEDELARAAPSREKMLAAIAKVTDQIEQDRLVVDALRAGATNCEVAEALGVGEWVVRRRFPADRRTSHGPRERAEVNEDLILELYLDGLSAYQIARRLEYSRGVVRHRLAKYGLAADPHGDR